MSLIEYIAISIAFGIDSMLVMRRHTLQMPIRLTHGLAVSIMLAIVFSVMFYAGIQLGQLLRFTSPTGDADMLNTNTMVFVGLVVLTSIKMLFSIRRNKKKELSLYDLSRWSTVVALSIASGINVMIVGMGIGFLPSTTGDRWNALIPIAIATWLLSYWGIMMGRQKVELRENRWLVVALLLLLSTTVYRITLL